MSYIEYRDYLTRLIYEIFRGRKVKDNKEIILFASLLYWSSVLILCRSLRLFVTQILIPNRDTKFKVLLTGLLSDLICAFQTTACSLERGFIYTAYGIQGYLLALFVLSLIYSHTFHSGSGNPCSGYARYLHSTATLKTTLLTFLVQVCGSLCGFHFALKWWSLGATSRHSTRLNSYLTDGCNTDLTVTLFYGCLIEFLGTLGEFLLTMSKPLWMTVCSERMYLFSRVFLSCMITWSGLDLTGMWNNPANASAQKFSCNGTGHVPHLFVYWCSPLLATRLAYSFESQLQNWRKSSPTGKDINSNETVSESTKLVESNKSEFRSMGRIVEPSIAGNHEHTE